MRSSTEDKRRCLVISFVVVVLSVPCLGQVITVAPDGSGDYLTIQAGIDAAPNSGRVVVADGVYTGSGNKNLDFKGKRLTVRSANGPENCIIDCGGYGRGVAFDELDGKTSVLRGFTICNGNARYGAGIYCENSSPRIENCIIENNGDDNTASGGIELRCRRNDAPVISGCIIRNNRGVGCGGIRIRGITAHGNEPVIIEDCQITYNAGNNAGGIHADNRHLKVRRSLIAHNDGRGIIIDSDMLFLDNCEIRNNNSNSWGGGLYGVNYADVQMTNCIVADNSAVKGGGGIYLTNRTNLIMTNCTIVRNSDGTNGGGLVLASSETEPATLYNCIIRSNTAPEGGQIALLGSVDPTLEVSYCDIQGGRDGIYDVVWRDNEWNVVWGAGNIDADPLFVDADGADDTPGTEDDDLHLKAGSPCIDAGCDAGVYEDIEGNVRPWDFPGVDNNGEQPEFDMGAYEYVSTIEVAMKLTPRTLNCGSKGNWVKAHLTLPEEFTVADIDPNRPAVLGDSNFESAHLDVFVNENELVEIEAAFRREDICSLANDWPDSLTVYGFFSDGNIFFGTSTVRIITPGLNDIHELAARWLEMDCSHPDWCGGADLNEDSIVDVADFALLQSGHIEFVGK